MDLVRKIMLKVEDSDLDFGYFLLSDHVEIDGFSPKEISYHFGLCVDAGLLDAKDCSYMSSPVQIFCVQGIKWNGHNFIDAVRDDTIWKKMLPNLEKLGESVLSVLVSIAGDEIRKIIFHN